MQQRSGFTLVELVVVILVLGILAGVAAPKLVNVSGRANNTVMRQSLAVVRDAIQLFAANNGGALPGADNQEATLKTDLIPYLRTFPENPNGVNPNKRDEVLMITAAGDLETLVDNDKGWIYHSRTGEFRANSDRVSFGGTKVDFEF